MSDFALVDASQPVAVGPAGFELAHAAMQYRLRYSVLDPFERAEIEMELLRRIRYVFQRNDILLPVSRLFGEQRGLAHPTIEPGVLGGWTRAALAAGGAAHLGVDAALAADVLQREGRLLLYAPDERIILPDGMDDWRFLLVHGEAVDSHECGLDVADPRRPSLPAWSLGPDASVGRVAERLARHIGRYAEISVRRAARSTSDLAALCRAVATEIENPQPWVGDPCPPRCGRRIDLLFGLACLGRGRGTRHPSRPVGGGPPRGGLSGAHASQRLLASRGKRRNYNAHCHGEERCLGLLSCRLETMAVFSLRSTTAERKEHSALRPKALTVRLKRSRGISRARWQTSTR